MVSRSLIGFLALAFVACGPSVPRPVSRTGTVQTGARCDFGGSRAYTCTSGLVCCYAGSTDGWGHCVEHCAE